MSGFFDILSSIVGPAGPEDDSDPLDIGAVVAPPAEPPTARQRGAMANSQVLAEEMTNKRKLNQAQGASDNLYNKLTGQPYNAAAAPFAVSPPASEDSDTLDWKKFGKNLSNGLIAGGATLGGSQQQAPGSDSSKEPKAPKPGAPGAPVPGVPAALPVVPNLQLNRPQVMGAGVPQVPQIQMPQIQMPQVQIVPQLQMPVAAPVDPNLQLTMPQPQLGQPGVVYSDKNLKTNISNTSKSDIKKFMNSISSPKNYDYKDAANGPHTRGGLMAQDLEKTNIGKSVVINTPKGKAIDTARLTTILASVHSNRINELERKLEEALNKKFKKGKR